MSKIDQALSADLLQICEQAGAQFHKVNGGYRSACPLHGGDGNNNFSVYEESGKLKWKCYSNDCGQGDVIDFVMKWKRLDQKGAIEYLTGGKKISNEEALLLASERKQRAEQYKNQKEQEYHEALEALWHAKAWETYYTNLLNSDKSQQLWIKRGIPLAYQSIWQLGYCEHFSYKTELGNWYSPSLVIPIFEIGNKNPINIRHRILQPVNPNDKYRPERPGLRSAPFVADTDRDHDRVLVVEGEIKAMVTCIALDDIDLQIFGIPGKNQFGNLVERLAGKDVYILFDPDAGEQAVKAAQAVKGKVIYLRTKIDDSINAGNLDGDDIHRLMRSARRY